jgi:hypothetical protein
MKNYKVTITEKLQKEVEVEADSRFEAERLVEKRWNDSEFILDAAHFKGVVFRAESRQRERGHER